MDLRRGRHSHVCPDHGLWTCTDAHCHMPEIASCTECEPEEWDEVEDWHDLRFA